MNKCEHKNLSVSMFEYNGKLYTGSSYKCFACMQSVYQGEGTGRIIYHSPQQHQRYYGEWNGEWEAP